MLENTEKISLASDTYSPSKKPTHEALDIRMIRDRTNPTVKYIKEACVKYVDTWKNVNREDIEVEVLTGGCSNLLWKAEQKTNCLPKAVVFRNYCSSMFVDRERERLVMDILSTEPFSVPVFHDEDDFRIEEFIPGTHPSTDNCFTDQLLEVVVKIHANTDDTQLPVVLTRCTKMLSLAKAVVLYDDNELLDSFRDVQGLTTELEWLKAITSTLNMKKGLCHNDLHSLNIIQRQDGKGLSLIDFEYSDYNFLAYEFANSFFEATMDNAASEWPHFACDESKYPESESQANLIQRYLAIANNTEVSEESVTEFLFQIQVCLLLSHFHWALWSIPSYEANLKTDAIEWG